MKVNITNWRGVALWSWNVPNEEDCGICRVSFDGTCPTCKFPGDGCPLVVGLCTHRFHLHCIVKWLDVTSSKNLCPMCRQEFKINEDAEENYVTMKQTVGVNSGTANASNNGSGDDLSAV